MCALIFMVGESPFLTPQRVDLPFSLTRFAIHMLALWLNRLNLCRPVPAYCVGASSSPACTIYNSAPCL